MKQYNRLLYLLALVKFITPFFLQHSFYQPHRDEFLYLAEGSHMAWGFMEVPPVLSVFAWLTHLFGDGIFWIKCWPSLFGALTFLATGKLILSLGGKWFALILGFLPFIFGGYLRMHFLFQPNFLEIFFWTMMAYTIIRFIQTGKNKWLYAAGISVGLGMMSKYSVAFFAASILTGLLLTKQRTLFKNKHLYFAFAIALIIFLPNMIWQYRQHFPVVHHMQELQQTQLQYINPLDFLIDQVIMNFPCAFIWLTGLIYVLFSKAAKDYRFIGWAYIAVIVLLLIGHGKNYYAMGAYPVLFAFGSVKLEQFTSKRYRLLRPVFLLFPLIIGIVFIPIALPIYTPPELAAYYAKNHVEKFGALKWEDQQNHPLPQDFSDMLGWEEMAKKMASAWKSLDSNEQKHTVLFCDNYGMAGAVNYYGHRYHLPEAYSDNASFLYWIPDSLHINNLILLTDDRHEMEHPFIKEFVSARVTDSITTEYAREKGDLVLILKGASEAFNRFFRKKIEQDKIELSGGQPHQSN